MKIGFLDVVTNKFNGYEAAASECLQQANVEIARLTAPDLLKVPVCAKKLFSENGADAVLAFIQTNGEEGDAVALVHEKIIDVEVNYGRLVFFCFVFDDEWRTAEELAQVAGEKIVAAIEEIIAFAHSPPEPGTQLPDFLTGGAPVEAPNETEPQEFLEEAGESEVHQLFEP